MTFVIFFTCSLLNFNDMSKHWLVSWLLLLLLLLLVVVVVVVVVVVMVVLGEGGFEGKGGGVVCNVNVQ